MSEPMLIVAAFWTEGDRCEEVSAALRGFFTPEGFHRGATVSFGRKQADDREFQLVMRKLNLEEVNLRPGDAQ